MGPCRTVLLGLLTALGLGVGSGLYAFRRGMAELEEIRAGLPRVQAPGEYRPALKTRILAADGTLLAEIYRENREYLPLREIPKSLIDATIASEDRRFREHIGVSPRDIMRALYLNLRHREIVQGASTITQQLARELYLSRQQSISRKVREALLAIEIEKQYSKDEILEIYLNQINYGMGAYGVRTASRMYFGKEPSELTLGECAALAAVPRRPTDYNLYRDPAGARRRRDGVLGEMARLGMISAAQRDAARREPLVVQPYEPPDWQPRRAPYYTSWAIHELVERLGHEAVLTGGLTVWTALDLELQRIADQAVAAAVRRGDGASAGAAVVIDPRAGRILAIVGGDDWRRRKFNLATQARRQPGSAFKAFVYTAAIDRGYRPSDTIQDEPFTLKYPNGDTWRPQNYDRRWHGEVTLERAFAESINIPAVRLCQRLGVESVIAYAQRMGITSPLRPYPSLALGTSEVTLLELTAAYGVFPAGGYRIEPSTIVRVQDSRGRLYYEHRPDQRAVLPPRTVEQMLTLFAAVMTKGTGKPAALDVPCGGKTGTTQNGRDAWFIGFTPRVVCGVWLGNDDGRARMFGVYGGTHCGPAWRTIVSAAIRKLGVGRFATDEWAAFQSVAPFASDYQVEITEQVGTVELELCADTMLLATPFCPQKVRKTFTSGAEPHERCPEHRATAPEVTGRETEVETAAPTTDAAADAGSTTTSPWVPPSALEPAPPGPEAASAPPPKRAPEPKPAPLVSQYVICADSGLLAKPGCPHKETREFAPDAAPRRECDLH